MWSDRTYQHSEGLQADGNTGTITEDDMSMGQRMLFVTVDPDFPVIRSVCCCHGCMVVKWFHYVKRVLDGIRQHYTC